VKESEIETISKKHWIQDKRISEIVEYLDRWSKKSIISEWGSFIEYKCIARWRQWSIVFNSVELDRHEFIDNSKITIYMWYDDWNIIIPLQILYENYVWILGSLKNLD